MTIEIIRISIFIKSVYNKQCLLQIIQIIRDLKVSVIILIKDKHKHIQRKQ